MADLVPRMVQDLLRPLATALRVRHRQRPSAPGKDPMLKQYQHVHVGS